MDNQNLFSQSYDQIIKNVLGKDTPYFQMMANPMSFNWPVASAGQIAPEAYQLMSASPAYSPVGDFTGIGTSTLFDNYKQVLAHVGYKMSPELEKQLQDLSNKMTAARNKGTKAYADAMAAYNVAKQNGGIIFEADYPTVQDWIKGPGQSFEAERKAATEEASDIVKQIASLNKASGSATMTELLEKIAEPTGAPNAGNSKDGWVLVPDAGGVLRWEPSFDISTSSQNWRAELSSGSIGKKTITLDASKSNDSINKSWAGGNVGISTPFWGVNVGGSWEETNISKDDNSVTATVTLESATTVLITPGDWYDGGFLKQLVKAGNTGTGYQILEPYTATGGDHALFGKDGLCSTMVTGLVVAYKPSFSVTMQSSTYKSFEQKIAASAGFRIGPFCFGGHGGHYEKNVHTTGNRTTVEGGSTSDDPVIIGVTLGFPGTEKP